MKPLAIDLYCGLGGWTEGLLAEGYRVVGFDIEQHVYGAARYPAQLVLQNVLTMHGAQLKDAALIVGSSPCQEFSYRAMPWKRAKALPPPYLGMELFNAQFRIQREACEAAGRYIPLVVENVCGAQKWVGRAKWHFGSFYLWGDVPALMPPTKKATKVGGITFSGYGTPGYKAVAFNGTADQRLRGQSETHSRGAGADAEDLSLRSAEAAVARSGVKQHGSGPIWFDTGIAKHSSKSTARKAASAHIAKIPLVLARHIARVYHHAPR